MNPEEWKGKGLVPFSSSDINFPVYRAVETQEGLVTLAQMVG